MRVALARSEPSKVLIVEDEAIISLDLQVRVSAMGLVVCGAVHSGHQAIDASRARGPDLILMDYKLRGALTGLDAARMIRAELAVPIIFLTGHRDSISPSVLEELGAGVLGKPFRDHLLEATIRSALGLRRSQ